MLFDAVLLIVDRFGRMDVDSGVAADGPIDILPGLVSVYFHDPNGIRLEACCQPAAGENPRVIASVHQAGAEMRRELDTLSSNT